MTTTKILTLILISVILSSCNSNPVTNDKPKETTPENKQIPTVTSFKLFKDFFEDPSISKTDYDGKEFIITDLVVMYVGDNRQNQREIKCSTYKTDDVFDGVTIPKPDGWNFFYVKVGDKKYRMYRGDNQTISVILKDPHQMSKTGFPKFETVTLTDTVTYSYPTNQDVKVYNDLKTIKVKGIISIYDKECTIEDGEVIN